MSGNNKQLEETFDLMPMENDLTDVETDNEFQMDPLDNRAEVERETALYGFIEHDSEMDKYASEAFQSYKDMFSFAMASPPREAAPIFQASESMLKLAMESKNSKIEKKLKMMEIQLKQRKQKFDERKFHSAGSNGVGQATEDGVVMSREDLLKQMSEMEDSDKDK